MSKLIILFFLTVLDIAAIAQWNPTTGPMQGTINQFYETSETIFVVSGEFGAGGVFSSSDNGEYWVIKNQGLPLTSKITSIYGDDDFIYAGVWQSGIFKSDNLGETWTESNNGISLSGLAINTLYEADGFVYAGSYFEGVYVSSDQGNTWVLKNNGLEGAAKRVASIVKMNFTLYVATPLGVYRSEDNGDNWINSSNGIPEDVIYSFDIVQKDDLLFVSVLDGIFRSTDNGLNWSRVGGDTFSVGVYDIAVFENEIYAGSGGVIYISTDNGNNWSVVGEGISSYSYIYAIHKNENTLICGVSARGIYSYNSDNDNWSLNNDGLINTRVTDMVISDESLFATTLIADFGHIFRTDDNGTNWHESNNGAWEGGFHSLLNTGSTLFAGTDGNYIYRSNDNGENWEHIAPPEFPASYVSSLCENTGVLFAGSFGFNIDVYRSNDNGSTWTGCNVPGQGDIKCLYSDGGNVFTGRSDGVYRTEDLGLSWTRTSDGMTDLPFISAIDGNEVYLFASSLEGLYRSSNIGGNWEKTFEPPISNRIQCITTHSDNVFIGTNETGLLWSDDNGENWETFNPDYFQDPTGIIPPVTAIEVKGDSIYCAYSDFGTWASPLPNLTSIEDDNLTIIENPANNFVVYPNPVVSISIVSYSLAFSSTVSLIIFDILGKEKMVLAAGNQQAGDYQVKFSNHELKPGLYFIILRIDDTLQHQKIIIKD